MGKEENGKETHMPCGTVFSLLSESGLSIAEPVA